MNNQPLVTVITPSFNQGEFISATIDSVLGQDYNRIEYLVIDGGSNDTTLEVLKSYTDPRLSWVSEHDHGQSDAINKGLRRASGDYITYLNSDDLLLPGAVRFIVDYFAEHSSVDLIYGDCQFLDASDEPVRIVKGFAFDIRQMILGTQILSQPGTFWRREVTAEIGYMDESLHFTMDVDYWLRAACAGFNLHYVSGVRSAFRLHGKSKTVSQQTKFWDDWHYVVKKVYASNTISPELLEEKEAALYRVEWNALKGSWLKQQYDLKRIKKFLGIGSLKRRVIAVIMGVEAVTHIPLLRWIFAVTSTLESRRLT